VRQLIPTAALVVLILASGVAPAARGQAIASDRTAPASAQPGPQRLEYRQDTGTNFGSLLLRAAGGLVLMAMLAFGTAVLAKRFLPGVRGYSQDGSTRIRLLESRRITPKLTLLVIEFEGRRLLLAQSGDRVVHVAAAADEPNSNTYAAPGAPL
jgi:hypothetical protein